MLKYLIINNSNWRLSAWTKRWCLHNKTNCCTDVTMLWDYETSEVKGKEKLPTTTNMSMTQMRTKTAMDLKRVDRNVKNLRDGFFLIFYRFESYFFILKCEIFFYFLSIIDNGIQGTGVYNLFWTFQWRKQMSSDAELWTQLLLVLLGKVTPW